MPTEKSKKAAEIPAEDIDEKAISEAWEELAKERGIKRETLPDDFSWK